MKTQPRPKRGGGEAQRKAYFLICTKMRVRSLQLDLGSFSPVTCSREISTCGLVEEEGKETICKRVKQLLLQDGEEISL